MLPNVDLTGFPANPVGSLHPTRFNALNRIPGFAILYYYTPHVPVRLVSPHVVRQAIRPLAMRCGGCHAACTGGLGSIGRL